MPTKISDTSRRAYLDDAQDCLRVARDQFNAATLAGDCAGMDYWARMAKVQQANIDRATAYRA